MSIIFSSATSTTAETTSITLAHTVSATIPNPVLVVMIATRAPTGGDMVTGVTYNGVAMTRLASACFTGASQENSFAYYMLNPPTGVSYNVVVTRTGAYASVVGALSYGGVHQIGAGYASGGNNASVVQAALTNSFHKSTVVVMPIIRGKTETLTWDANVTERVAVTSSGAPANQGCRAGVGEWTNQQAGVLTTAGGTWSNSAIWAVTAIEFAEMQTRMIT